MRQSLERGTKYSRNKAQRLDVFQIKHRLATCLLRQYSNHYHIKYSLLHDFLFHISSSSYMRCPSLFFKLKHSEDHDHLGRPNSTIQMDFKDFSIQANLLSSLY